eukprot:m.20159 g.20159  ORF g.20159 m.20159 type:complete len:56 (+) comp10143_c0_seq1:1744-1911(+)
MRCVVCGVCIDRSGEKKKVVVMVALRNGPPYYPVVRPDYRPYFWKSHSRLSSGQT